MSHRVYLIGVGPGGPEGMTGEARAAIEDASVLVGAARLLDPWRKSGKALSEATASSDIAARVAEAGEGAAVAVLFSGDVGFYSGGKSLSSQLENCETVWVPGVSSLAAFCARLRTPWQDAFAVSAHSGKADVVGAVKTHEKTFFLAGVELGPREICGILKEAGMGDLPVWVGELIGCPGEKVRYGRADELARQKFDAPAVLLVANPQPERLGVAVPGIPDGDFAGDGGAAACEEVRTLALSKLRLNAGHVLWDLGAGSGAFAVQAALAVPEGQVYALESGRDALDLLARNKAAFGAANLKLVAGAAPEALSALPAPDRVFLGGGPYEPAIRAALEKNPRLRAVAAVTALEDLSDALSAYETLGLGEPEVVQLQISRTHGPKRDLLALNPVWLITGEGRA